MSLLSGCFGGTRSARRRSRIEARNRSPLRGLTDRVLRRAPIALRVPEGDASLRRTTFRGRRARLGARGAILEVVRSPAQVSCLIGVGCSRLSQGFGQGPYCSATRQRPVMPWSDAAMEFGSSFRPYTPCGLRVACATLADVMRRTAPILFAWVWWSGEGCSGIQNQPREAPPDWCQRRRE
jgi:hypothetical protein